MMRYSLLNDEVQLVPGYQTFDKKFYPCPLLVWYIQINELQLSVEDKYQYKASIVVFSKDFAQHKQLDIKVYSNSGAGILGKLNYYINALNRYVEYDNDVNLLDSSIFKERINFTNLDERALFEIVNQLSFRYYENCLVRVGKDNLFWSEIEITNLPQSNYLRKCFLDILTNGQIINSAKYDLEKGFILIEYGREYAYSPSQNRKEVEVDKRKELEIKDFIKYKLQNVFDPVIEMNEHFT
jgi:hypothetical protein